MKFWMDNEKLDMQSVNEVKKCIEMIETRYPSVITEIRDKNGKICKGVNLDLLRQMLTIEVPDENERYEFTWIGKSAAIAESNTPTRKTLRPVIADSKDWPVTENLYIEGDNLDVLKLLQKSYQSRIKMIYIDPPYNTRNELIYQDDFSMDMENKRSQNSGLSGAKRDHDHMGFHSGWCSMIYPRLKLARNLMTEDGVIFISIDENELDNLKKICDEIFGESNFITIIGLEITKTQGLKVKSAKEGSIVKNYEYIVCYAKSTTNKKIVKNLLYDKNEGYDAHFSYYIEKKEGQYGIRKLVDVLAENTEIYDEFIKYDLLDKRGKINIRALDMAISVSGKIREYLYRQISGNIYQEMACGINIDPAAQERLQRDKIIEYNGYLLTKSSGGKLRQYASLAETLKKNDEYRSEYGRVTIRGNLWKGFYSDMMNVAKEGGVAYKNGKKPVRLICQLAKWIGVGDGDTVLDFFAGSATTAHAVMALNAEDLGYRKYIMIQLNENLDKLIKTASGKNRSMIQKTIEFLDSRNRPHFLSELGKQRIMNVAEKITEVNRGGKSQKANPTKKEKLDTGFRVFRLEVERTDLDLLFGIILDLGFSLTVKTKMEEIGHCCIYSVFHQWPEQHRDASEYTKSHHNSDGSKSSSFCEYQTQTPILTACFSDEISKDIIIKIAQRQPIYAIFKASAIAGLLKESELESIYSRLAPNSIIRVI